MLCCAWTDGQSEVFLSLCLCVCSHPVYLWALAYTYWYLTFRGNNNKCGVVHQPGLVLQKGRVTQTRELFFSLHPPSAVLALFYREKGFRCTVCTRIQQYTQATITSVDKAL